MAPRAFGKYIVTQPLGFGGSAAVFLAQDPDLGRLVAIKVIHAYLALDPSLGERFRREARLVASLRHPHIVQLHGFDVADDQPFMVMEYLEGGSLRDRLADRRAAGTTWDQAEVLSALQDLASALDYAHAHGAVHRDIKPGNILFTAMGEIVLTDFGIAKLLDELTQLSHTGSIIGTPVYMSPEQATGKPIDQRSDIYSLGIVIYEMLAGRAPFEGDSPTVLLMKHVSEPPPPLSQFRPGLAPALEAVLARALAKDPAERFASGGEFALAFGEAIRASPPAQLGRPEALEAPTLLEAPGAVETSPTVWSGAGEQSHGDASQRDGETPAREQGAQTRPGFNDAGRKATPATWPAATGDTRPAGPAVPSTGTAGAQTAPAAALRARSAPPTPPSTGATSSAPAAYSGAAGRKPAANTASAAPAQADSAEGDEMQPAPEAEPPAAADRRPLARRHMIMGAVALLLVIAASASGIVWLRSRADSTPQPVSSSLHLAFRDSSDSTGRGRIDQVALLGSGLAMPAAGRQYEAWLLGGGDARRRDLGPLQINSDGVELTATDPNGSNLLANFDGVEITLEPSDRPKDAMPSNQVILRGNLPSGALAHVRHLLVPGSDGENGGAFAQGLVTQAQVLVRLAALLRSATDADDLGGMTNVAEAMANVIAGPDSPGYGDVNGDGMVNDRGDGAGLLPAGDRPGYIQAVLNHARLAEEQPDASANIKEHASHVEIAAANTNQRAQQLRTIAMAIAQAKDVAATADKVRDVSTLTDRLLNGQDTNGNEKIEPIPGEGGALSAFEHAQLMADIALSAQ